MSECVPESTVMIVDDVPANLKLLTVQLKRIGYRVVTFPDGKSALHAAAENPPDIILLDINMPEMNGYEVCRELKADQVLKDIPVLFISALSATRDKVEAFEAGGVDYITKPFQIDEVQSRVATHLELRRKEQELLESCEKLKKMEQMRDGLVHMLIHDLRTPLAGILGTYSLLKTAEDEKESALFIREGERIAYKLVEMVNTILDINKMESGELVPDRSLIDLPEMIHEAVQDLSVLLEGRSIDIKMTSEPILLYCDRGIIFRVIQNLIANAVSHTHPDHGFIGVEVRKGNDQVRVSVLDDGPGIPEEFHTRIFEKFGQVSGKRHSTGLGLAFCKMVVESHGGKIGVENREGKGSLFWFTLPTDPELQGGTGR